MNIYIVGATSGEHEDFRERIVKAFASKQSAEQYASMCKREGGRLKRDGDGLLDVEGIEDNVELWSIQYEKWANQKNKYDPDWNAHDYEADYFMYELNVVSAKEK